MNRGRPALDRLAIHERPDVCVEGAALILNRQKLPGVDDGALHLEAVSNDARVHQDLFESSVIELRHKIGIETRESGTIPFALFENGLPAQTGLCTLEHQELEML